MITVITTIANPTKSVRILARKLSEKGSLIIIGDKKGPTSYDIPNAQFYSLEKQLTLDFKLANKLPTGHYSRKNIGYLLAMQQGEDCIYETDDDNKPNEYWKVRNKKTSSLIAENTSWINVYKHFSSENIWPRGFLIDRITDSETIPRHNGKIQEIEAPIQQGLANISPDVDAIWRLTRDREFYYERNESIALQEGSWCPFNTQSTWWWKEAFPLLYLPSYCSFRMTDIWKSFVAQRCLWEMDYKLVFHAPEADQDRNIHDLMKDFEAEVPGYLSNERLTQVLEATKLASGIENTPDNLIRCYEALTREGIFPKEELTLVKAWVNDLNPLLF